jgi:hypothetical protein
VATLAGLVVACSGDSGTEPEPPTPPERPTTVRAESTSPDAAVVTWTDNSDDEDSFRVERRFSTSADTGYQVAGSTGAGITTFQDTGLNPETTYEYRVQACNTAGCAASLSGASVTTQPLPLAIVLSSLPAAEETREYSQALSVVGGEGAVTWELVEGTLPTGILLSDEGVLTGIADGTGVYPFQVAAATPTEADTADFSLTVIEPTVRIQTRFLRGGYPGVPYTDTLVADGGEGAPTYSVASGSLPEGLTLDPATGIVSGTPTGAGAAIFTASAVDEGGDQDFRILSLGISTAGPEAFNLWPVNVSGSRPDDRLVTALNTALAKWERALVGDLPALEIPAGTFSRTFCAERGSVVNGQTIDDLVVLVRFTTIDGPGSVLGQAGPCNVRQGSLLPWVGILTLDTEDLTALTTQRLTDLFFHEIGHILGFGTLWAAEPDDFGVDVLTGLARPAGADPDPRYDGPAGVAQYQAIGGTDPDIAVEALGGSGTANGHWRDDPETGGFDDEIMTGFLNDGANPLSKMTIGSFADLGYEVDVDADEGYTVPGTAGARGAPGREPTGILGYDVLLDEPIGVTSPDGRPLGILERR